ncbi:MAG: PIN domain-containing protein [Prosthecobacter sp.]|jgi:predicted nucleic acid-binding protein
MKPFADASFIVAAFARCDEHNPRAWHWWNRHGAAVQTSRLVLFEAENTLRGFPRSGKCSENDARNSIEGMNRAVLEGLIERKDAPLHRLLPLARRLSMHHTPKNIHGAMDILHVATALEIASERFLTFDDRQGDMAEHEGLILIP